MTQAKYRIVDVNADNIDEIGLYCSRSKHKEEGYQQKLAWIKERFQEGLEYRVLLVDEGRKDFAYRGMIEFMPGEKCWRGINAPNYMVIHCIWVIGRHKHKGYGTLLLQECLNSAREKKMYGVGVITITRGSWSPKKNLFVNNGFEKYDDLPPNFELYAFKFSESAPDPAFHPLSEDKLGEFNEGFTILSSCQCPYMAGTIVGIKSIAKDMRVNVTVKEIQHCEQAQKNGLHPYGTFHVILDGKYLTHLPGGMRDIKRELARLQK